MENHNHAPEKGTTTRLAAKDYVQMIRKAWTSSREAIFEAGNQLLIAKKDLEHGDFEPMIENDLPFGKSTAQKLMKIASCDLFKDLTIREKLPVSWGTLYELQNLEEDVFRSNLDAGAIHSEMKRRDVFEITEVEKRAKAKTSAEKKLADQPSGCSMADLELLPEGLVTVYADLPWKGAGDNADGLAMTKKEICSIPVNEKVGDNAHLFLWVRPSKLIDGLDIIRAWGFSYKAHFVWVDPNANNIGGDYWAGSHEILLLGVKGKARFRDNNVQSHLSETAAEGNRKPSKIREMIEQVSLEGSRIELFAHDVNPGWISWGPGVSAENFLTTIDKFPIQEAA